MADVSEDGSVGGGVVGVGGGGTFGLWSLQNHCGLDLYLLMPLQVLTRWQTFSQSTCLHDKGCDGRAAVGLRMALLHTSHFLVGDVGPGLLSMSPAIKMSIRRTAAGSCSPASKNTME